ncbi:MAG: helix-turn-helix transcriptional regulator [Gemmatimonadota bacterium]|nr:MAG: helix-turn-helix transcriptional regulator [Gemmatimonadota bacterium]
MDLGAAVGFKQHWFYILLALAQGATHGAEIRRRVAEHTEGTLKMYPAMLYGSLEDLLDQGYITEIDERSGRPTGENERYRYYRLCLAGRKALAAETRRLEQVTRIAREAMASGRAT